MEFKDIALGILTVLGATYGWLLRTLWDATEKVRDDLHKLESGLPRHYVSKDDLRDWKDEILRAIDGLREDLKGKADK